MNECGTGRIPGVLAKGIGGLTVVLGGVWVVGALWPLVRVVSGAKELENGWFMFLMVPLLAIPGALAVIAGYLFLREVNLPNLKAVVGLFAALGGLVVYSRLAEHFHEHGLWHERIDVSAFFLIGIVIGVLIYLLGMRWLVPAMGMKWAGCRSVLNKGVFLLMAWQLWQVSAGTIGVLFQNRESLVWGDLLQLLVPLISAVVFYKLGVRWLAAGQQVPSAPTS